MRPIEVDILRNTDVQPPRFEKRPGRPRRKCKERYDPVARRGYRFSQCGEDALFAIPPPAIPLRRLNKRKRQAASNRRALEAFQHVRQDFTVADDRSDPYSNINVAQASNSGLTNEIESNRSVSNDRSGTISDEGVNSRLERL
ncbi:hypothetical protein B0J12DRAFT_701239 [Macrophomina phaseolina]|uniref:Uncharacterized protein n=1 Tax=Macrophomina phaseolina TaxID=35725 RepID=A0ABQ8G4Z6_9PEZI|nr:hypothetical protein B0J12DRAFT_701239 [Macrophomina phaseolina]